MTIDPAIMTEVRTRLSAIEEAENVRILFAVESGSRAWGFPSRDSDYDIRSIYVRTIDWYLSIDVESKRDVIEPPVDGEFDFAGWDVRKALRLFAKSNPPFLEWLDSSIVYCDRHEFAQTVRDLRSTFFSPLACAYHYLHMAQGNYRTYLRGARVWLKKYFYVLRPLLAVRWIEQGRGVVPMHFERLLATVKDQTEVQQAIDELLRRKLAGDELDEGPSNPVLQDFIDRELLRMEHLELGKVTTSVDMNKLNDLFRSVINDSWSPLR